MEENPSLQIKMMISKILELVHDIGQIDVIDIWVKNDTEYKYLFMYENSSSKFTVLKPLKTNTIKEIAEEFLDVIKTIGAPLVLQSPKGKDFVNQVVDVINSEDLNLPILCEDNLISDESFEDIRNLLDSWLYENPSKSWLEGIEVVQVIKNEACEFISQDDNTVQILNSSNSLDYLSSDKLNSLNEQQNWNKLRSDNSIANSLNDCTFYPLDDPDILVDDDFEPSIDAIESDVNEVPPSNFKLDINAQITESICIDNVCAIPRVIVEKNSIDYNPSIVELQVSKESLSLDEVLNALDERVAEIQEEKKFDCDICGKKCKNLENLEKHVKSHSLYDKYSCPKCYKCFNILRLFNKHMENIHPDFDISSEVLKAQNCSNISKFPSLHKVNIKSDDNTKISKSKSEEKKIKVTLSKLLKANEYTCDYCKESFPYPSYLKRHIRSHTHGKRFDGVLKCEDCGKTFNEPKYLKLHVRSHEKKQEDCLEKESTEESLKSNSIVKSKRLSCEFCDETFTFPSILERHILSHKKGRRSNRILKCEICNKTFKYPSYLKRHMRIHTNERPYRCNLCNQRFLQSSHLTHHLFTHVDYQSKTCADCHLSFDTLQELIMHCRQHEGELRFLRNLIECEICKMIFKTKESLRRHMLTHSQQKPYLCETCNLSFKQRSQLENHARIHSEEKNFNCTVCGKMFKHKRTKDIHMLRHTKIKPHECDKCGAAYLEKRNLKYHMLTHTQERPYECKFCNKR